MTISLPYPDVRDPLGPALVADQCAAFANDIATAFQQMFDIGGWNAVLWVFIGWGLGGGFSRLIDWIESRFFVQKNDAR